MIPDLPPFFDMIYTKDNGRLANDGFLYNDQLAQTLHAMQILLNEITVSTFSNTNGVTVTAQGLIAPSLTAAQVLAMTPTAAIGTIWFNTGISKLQVITATNTLETITSA